MKSLFASALLLSLAPAALAQIVSGTIVGTATDTSGAVVPKASITVASERTGVTRSTTADESGSYALPQLPPGEYRLAAAAQGFKKYEVSGITLLVAQTVRVDVRFEVGAITQEVRVTAAVATLESETSSPGQVVDRERIVELPLNGRNDRLDAANYFDNFFRNPKAPSRQNQFGVTAGGALIKNKLFYFGSWEALRSRRSSTLTALVPTPEQPAGNLAGLLPTRRDPAANAPAILDPLTGQLSPGNRIPSDRISSVTRKFIRCTPQPNANIGGRNFVTTKSTNRDGDQWGIRMDYEISSSDSLFGRYTDFDSFLFRPGVGELSGSIFPYAGRNVVVQQTHVANPRVLNVFKFGYTRARVFNSWEITRTSLANEIGPGSNPPSSAKSRKSSTSPICAPASGSRTATTGRRASVFAYRLSDSTALRGGYGVFYSKTRGNELQFKINAPPLVFAAALAGDINRPTVSWDRDAFPDPASPDFPVGTLSPFSVDPRDRTPYLQQWNLSLMRSLSSGLLLELAYAGSKGTKLTERVNDNQGTLPDPNSPTPLAARRPHQGFGDILAAHWQENSSYNGLHARLEKRFSAGLSFLLAYTWSHSIDTASRGSGGSWHQNSRRLRDDRGNSDFDVRHRFSYSYVYQLPFGRGKRFLSSAGPVADRILGGGALNGIVSFMTGNYFAATVAGDRANVGGFPFQRANRSCDGNLPRGQRTIRSLH